MERDLLDPRPAIVASVLNADQGRLAAVCSELERNGVDAIQWDVMEGDFVPNLTVGPDVIAACREATSLPFLRAALGQTMGISA